MITCTYMCLVFWFSQQETIRLLGQISLNVLSNIKNGNIYIQHSQLLYSTSYEFSQGLIQWNYSFNCFHAMAKQRTIIWLHVFNILLAECSVSIILHANLLHAEPLVCTCNQLHHLDLPAQVKWLTPNVHAMLCFVQSRCTQGQINPPNLEFLATGRKADHCEAQICRVTDLLMGWTFGHVHCQDLHPGVNTCK